MSFVINGQTWTPETALQHAQSMLTDINNDRLSRGQSVLVPTIANAIWIILLGVGSELQNIDNDLLVGLNSLNPSLCDDQQILELLPMVGTTLQPGTESTVEIQIVTNTVTSGTVVPAGSLLPFGNVNFVTNEDAVVSSLNETVTVLCHCDTIGAVVCPADSLTSFSVNYPHVTSVSNSDPAAVGSDPETITQVRNRIINGITRNWGIDAAIRAIRALVGITACNIFFNFSGTDSLTLAGGISVDPRTAYIVIQGSSDGIALAYAQAMSAPTQGDQVQNWVTLAGQEVPINYNLVTNKDVWVQVFYDDDQPFQAGFDSVVQQDVLAQQANMYPGQVVTGQFFSSLFNNFALATITGITVSLDGVTYARLIEVDANKYPVLATARIIVTAES